MCIRDRRSITTVLAALLASAISCWAPQDTRPPEMHSMGPGLAPTPFSAEEIRAGCPVGRCVEYRIEKSGQPPVLQFLVFVGEGDRGSEIESHVTDLSGQALGAVTRTRATWTELQSHASFPTDATTITSESTTTPLGTHACWHYEVRDEESGEPRVRRYWFAKDRPGPPLRMEEIVGERTTSRTMLSDTRTAPR